MAWSWSLRCRSASALLAVAGTACAAAPQAPASTTQDVLVAARPDARLPPGARVVARLGGLRFSTVRVPPGARAAGFARSLARRTGVAGAQPNTPIRRASIAGTCVDTPTAPLLDVAAATGAQTRRPPATTRPVAVLDTGVDPAVPELAGRVLPASLAVSGPVPAQADDDGHGTQVAAAAAGAAGLVAGTSPTSPVMPIRIATASVLATPATIVKGLEIAATRDARVAVLPSSQPLSQVAASTVSAVGAAVNAAFTEGVITVVPAGNEGENEPVFPGGLTHVLTVGSAASAAGRDEFSNTGPWIDLVAPGADRILPAPPSICLSGYARASGTSFAAATVAGAVALIGAVRPSLTTTVLWDIVRRAATTDAAAGGFDVNTGFGLLNVAAGLSASAGAADPSEVNDDVYWLRRRPSAFPALLRRTQRAVARGTVSPGKDPKDAFKVYVRRGQVLRASVTNLNAKAVLYTSIWSTRTRDFDMRLPAPSTELRDSGGFTQNPRAFYRASRTGTYYVAVFAPEWTVPGEQGTVGKDLAPLSPQRTVYRLTLTRGR